MTANSALLAGGTSGERRRSAVFGAVAPPVWDPNGPTGAGIAAPLWDALRDAADEVHGQWERAIEHAASQYEVAGYTAQLCSAVRAVMAGIGVESALAELSQNALSRRLLGLLRTSFLARVQVVRPVPDSLQLIRVLNAIEKVAVSLEPEWAEHLSDRLSGPDGLELVVEVAHDLRSPLTSILFLAETLQRGRSGPVNQIQERQLGLIYSAAFGLSSVASDVIELARGGDRLIDLDPVPFSLTDILESVRDIVQPIAEEKGLSVRLSLPPADYRIGHPVALSRVLLNLTTNALKFTNEGYVEVSARASEDDDRLVEFSVRDTGRGIPPQSMATLYEPFRRRQRQGEYAFSGSGLGLSICRKLVEAMGSQLAVETQSEQGTRFYFTLDLPLVPSTDQ